MTRDGARIEGRSATRSLYASRMTTHELRVEGMSCQHCVKSVREALLRVPGVSRVDVEIGRARVEGDVDPRALAAALDTAGYRVA